MDSTEIISVLNFIMCFSYLAGGSPNIAEDAVIQCGQNETMARCPLCDRDCSQAHMFDAWSADRNRKCPETCLPNAAVCVCESGFYRNPNGDCVVKEECPPPCPWINEEANYCDLPLEPRCQPTCSNPNHYPNGTLVILDPQPDVPRFFCRYGICHTLVCACKKGYVRHDVTMVCVKRESCPSIPLTTTSTLSPAPSVNDAENSDV